MPQDVIRQVQAFRAGLDALPAGPATVQALLSEAVQSFELHCTLFDQLSDCMTAMS
jgi:heme oxygenase